VWGIRRRVNVEIVDEGQLSGEHFSHSIANRSQTFPADWWDIANNDVFCIRRPAKVLSRSR
tara:strand:+ start:3407 stop:3589 length:183 start_codon:yes stop_codon:yes gene_type:complete